MRERDIYTAGTAKSSTLNQPKNPGCPILRAFAKGGMYTASTTKVPPRKPKFAYARAGHIHRRHSKVFHSQPTQKPRVPHPSRLCEGWDCKTVRHPALFFRTSPGTVISTGVVPIVNGGAKKSASRPPSFAASPLRHHPDVHKNHAIDHVLSTFLQSKNHTSSSQTPEETARQTKGSPEKPKTHHNPPQLTTKTEDSFYPQPSGPS
jgi:hypothetical protein